SVQRRGQQQVAEFRTLVLVADQDILRCDVSMNKLLLMGGLEGLGQLDGDTHDVTPVQQLRGAAPPDDLGQAAPLDVLHGDPAVRPRDTGAQMGQQVRMLERLYGLESLREERTHGWMFAELRTKHFEGNYLRGSRIPSPENAAPVSRA